MRRGEESKQQAVEPRLAVATHRSAYPPPASSDPVRHVRSSEPTRTWGVTSSDVGRGEVRCERQGERRKCKK